MHYSSNYRHIVFLVGWNGWNEGMEEMGMGRIGFPLLFRKERKGEEKGEFEERREPC